MSLNKTYVAGTTVIAAADLNGLQAPWDTYTPTWTASVTNPTLVDGTLAGHYLQVGKRIDFWIKLTIGPATSVGSGQYKISLPVAPLATAVIQFDLLYFDASAGSFYRGVAVPSGGSTVTFAYDGSGAGGVLIAMTAAAPVVPAVGDVYTLSGTYEAA